MLPTSSSHPEDATPDNWAKRRLCLRSSNRQRHSRAVGSWSTSSTSRTTNFEGVITALLTFAVGAVAGHLLVLIAIPSAICALLFRGGLLMYVFGIAVVTRNGSRASRLRTFWRSLLTWVPCVLLPMLILLLTMSGLAIAWSLSLVLALVIALIAWSASIPERGIPDRLAGTYPVPR